MPKKKLSEEESAVKKTSSSAKKSTLAKSAEKLKNAVTKKAEEKPKKAATKVAEKEDKKTSSKKTTEKSASKTKKEEVKEIKATTAKKDKKIESKKALPKAEEKEKLPKVEKKKALPKVEKKKELPKAEKKKELPKPKTKKALPKTKESKLFPKTKAKKALSEKLTPEEKDKRLLEKIKEFFSRNPEKTTELDANIEQQDYLPEYYDLPYRYNETVVKILAQTPKRLFIYWDISDSDIEKYRKAFGEDFFERTYPVLLVHNEELNYTYEVPINDFANSWYLDIKDSKSKYTVQLGRKFKARPQLTAEVEQMVMEENINLQNDYIEIVSSNTLEAPNDHVLFERLTPHILYRNVKTGAEETKDITTLISGIAKAYNVYDLYKLIYKDEFDGDMFNLNNPSSAGNPSSSSTSSWFK